MTLEQQRALALAAARKRKAEAQGHPEVDGLTASTTGVLQGLTANFGDEIMAGALTPIEMGIGAFTGRDKGKGLMERFGDNYDLALERERNFQDAAQEQHPVAHGLGQVGGALGTAGQLAKGGVTFAKGTKAGVLPLAAQGAKEGAVYGTAYGLGEGEGVEDRLTKGAFGTALGVATGGALGAGTGAVLNRSAKKAAIKAAPTIDDRRATSSALYKQAEGIGLRVSAGAWDRALSRISGVARKKGVRPRTTPTAQGILDEFSTESGKQLTLSDLDELRQIAGQVARGNNPSESRAAGVIIEELDSFIDDLSPLDVVSGDPKQATALIKEARKNWQIVRKSEIIEDVMERVKNNAQTLNNNEENAIRTEFRRIANNKKLFKQFNKDEKNQILKIIRGTSLSNALRFMGRFSPSSQMGTFLSGILGGGAGGMVGGPAGALAGAAALGAVGGAGRGVAGSMTSNAAKIADAMVRSGSKIAPKPQITAAQREMLGMASREGTLLGQ